MSDTKSCKSLSLRIATAVVWSLIGLNILAVAGAWIAVRVLTPERLGNIVGEELSARTRADMTFRRIDWEIFGSFPFLHIEIDSACIRSRVFDHCPDSVKASLPHGAAYLAGASAISGDIDILQLMAGRYRIRNLEIDGLKLNLVKASDSLANYMIADSFRHRISMPDISADSITLRNARTISYRSVPDSISLLSDATCLQLRRIGSSSVPSSTLYRVNASARITAAGRQCRYADATPLHINGKAALSLSPLNLHLHDLAIASGPLNANVNAFFSGLDSRATLHDMKVDIKPCVLASAMNMFPDVEIPEYAAHMARYIYAGMSIRIPGPCALADSRIPSLSILCTIPAGVIPAQGNRVPEISHGVIEARFDTDSLHPDKSVLTTSPFHLQSGQTDVMMKGCLTGIPASPQVTMSVSGKSELEALATIFPSLRRYHLHGKLLCSLSIQADSSLFSTAPMNRRFDRLKITGSATAEHISCFMPSDSMLIEADGIAVSFHDKGSRKGDTQIALRSVSFRHPAIRISIDRPVLSASTRPVGIVRDSSRRSHYTTGSNVCDRQLMDRIPHTAEWIKPSLPPGIADLISHNDIQLRLKAAGGKVESKAYPVSARMGRLDMEMNTDSIVIHNLQASSQQSAFSLNGKFSNLREFFTAISPAPLYATLDIALDTININQLAHTYEQGRILLTGRPELHCPAVPEAADTVTMLIPRNLKADIHATAKETIYTNLHLQNLASDIRIDHGIADIRNIATESDFGKASMKMRYDTSDLNAISMDADAALEDINVAGFFRNFHKLLLMMPQMKNLDGNITAQLSASMNIFPDMNINIPSVNARMKVEGSDLTVHQDPFIHRMARMLLIHTEGDLHINDMKVNASLHDNLLELYPFIFEFDRYRLQMLGINNLNGNLYYHIGVLKSPVPFPFGINITGDFDHPSLRFGGASFKTDKGEEVSSRIICHKRINMIYEMRHFLQDFLRHAADADTSPASDYVY